MPETKDFQGETQYTEGKKKDLELGKTRAVDNNARGSNIPCEKVQQSVDNKRTRADRMFVSRTKTTPKSV